MRTRAGSLLAAAVLGGGLAGVLTGCTEQPATSAETPPASSTTSPSDPGDLSKPIDRSEALAGADRAPLGLEVRYVDEHGRFVTVRPEDFPR